MKVFIGAGTDLGQRSNNEDSYAVMDVTQSRVSADGVIVIADGMGGRNFGEMASQVAVETIQETLIEMLGAGHTVAVPISDALDSALRKANARVYELAQEDPACNGMGTTCVAAVIGNNEITIAHVGDSRAYLLRDTVLEQITDDHSYVAEQVKAGVLTKANARKSQFRNVITRAVGIEPAITPDLSSHDLTDVRALLLCTDGLTNMVSDEDLAQVLAYATTAQEAADILVGAAKRNGGSDNITAVVARFRVDAPLADEDETTGEAAQAVTVRNTDEHDGQRSRHSLLPAIAMFFLVFLIGLLVFMGLQMTRDGYDFQASPPFFVKPPAPVVLPPANLTQVTYEAPTLFYTVPVRGGNLTRSANGTLTVVTLTGQVVSLSADGKVKVKYALPTHSSLGKNSDTVHGATDIVHSATDAQSNVYIANSQAATITKVRPDGKTIALIGQGMLVKPEALAVAENGSIYVIDAQRLKVLRARPANK